MGRGFHSLCSPVAIAYVICTARKLSHLACMNLGDKAKLIMATNYSLVNGRSYPEVTSDVPNPTEALPTIKHVTH